MTSKQRKQYITLHAVRELARGMAEQTGLESKTRASLSRIRAKSTEMMRNCGTPTETDARYFRQCADKLIAAWEDDGDQWHTPKAFIAIGLTLVADQYAATPKTATQVRKDFADLEGMFATLYGHFDPEFEDTTASKQGEAVANEYRALVAA